MFGSFLGWGNEEEELVNYGYVMMSNHIHLLAQAKDSNLSDVLRDFKKFMSQRIIAAIEGNAGESRKRWLMWLLTSERATEEKAVSYRFWQSDNGAEICFSLPFVWQKLNYIHDNPVRAGIVNKAEEYVHSSAVDYVNGKLMRRVKIEWLDGMVVTE